MIRQIHYSPLVFFTLLFMGGLGCQTECFDGPMPPDLNTCLNTAGGGPSTETELPDFSLRDVNPSSERFDTMVSPRDYQGEISAWYFGHST